MFQSVLVYGFMMFSMYFLGKTSIYKPQYRKYLRFISVFIFVVFCGLRYDVGVDFLTYNDIFISFTDDYTNASAAIYATQRYESGFKLLVQLCSYLGMGPQVIFAVFALIQISCVYYVFKDERQILPYIGFALIAGGGFFMWMNAVRQITSFTLFLVAAKMLYEKRYLYVLLMSVSACLMHKSAVLFLPVLVLLPFLSKSILSIKWQIILFVFSLVISNLQVWKYFSDIIMSVLSFMGDFGERYSSDTILDVNVELDFGMRMAITIVLNLVCIFYSKHMSSTYNPIYNYFYNIFFVGTILMQLFIDNHHLTRYALYFSSITFAVYSYLLAYLGKQRNKYDVLVKFVVIILLLLYWFRTLQADDGTASILYKFCFRY